MGKEPMEFVPFPPMSPEEKESLEALTKFVKKMEDDATEAMRVPEELLFPRKIKEKKDG